MKGLIGLLTISLLAVYAANAQSQSSPLQLMVETERAFAQASFDKSTREAFLAFIADDGILFRPTAVKGKEWILSHPLPPSPKRQLLSWQPTFADISASGDLGYTTGPWQFRPDINDEKPSAFGDFITVWKKQPDGSWKFAVDLGISHPEPTLVSKMVEFAKESKSNRKKKRVHSSDLIQQEQLVSAGCKKVDARTCFAAHLAKDARLFRESKLPFVGSAAAIGALTEAMWTWQPIAADVSQAGDIGYSYGTYELKDGNSLIEHGNYLRVWKNEDGVWKVVIDVANPLPEDKKN
jgi:ketosteroid isomerase-like protein